ncbi:MAG: aminotransferase class III-fold pyridoxal phosphate-dependent enzyme [Bacillota bacterium]|nr:aminotransferase class III-fold pyridoxal phosphate-dependent enzyme [Bacillota bacterium]
MISRINDLENKLMGKLLGLSQEYDLIKEIRGKGLMIAIEFNGAGDRTAARIHEQLFNRGYLASLRRGRNTLHIDLPLNIDEALLDSFVGELRSIITEEAQSYY